MQDAIIVDSQLEKEIALGQNLEYVCPEDIIKSQKMIEVRYYSFDGKLHQGQIVIHEDLIEDVKKIFSIILAQKFPITSVIPVADRRFYWDDDLSMQADNSSGFNYRIIALTTNLSNHAYGRALDINPRRNPYTTKHFIKPENSIYRVTVPGTLISGDTIVSSFKEMGWTWGGDWKDREDYQHFEKPLHAK